MPQYKVISKGFYNGQIYDPEGKRRVLNTDLPFKKDKLPSWLAEMPKETDAAKKKRESVEKAAKKSARKKAEQDKQEIEDASFMGEGESAGGTVETL